MVLVLALASLAFEFAIIGLGIPIFRLLAAITWVAAGMLWFILLRSNSRDQ